MRILKWAGFGFLGVIGAVGLLAAAMWASEDVRYRVFSAVAELVNDDVSPAKAERHFRALRSVVLIDSDGKVFDWHKGSQAVVWFNLWSYFCVPCRMEFLDMAALRGRVGRDKLRIVLLSQPQYWEADKRLAKELGLDFELVTTQDATVDQLAAIDFGVARDGGVHGEVFPSSSFQSASGDGLAAFQAPGTWDSDRWEEKVRGWYESSVPH